MYIIISSMIKYKKMNLSIDPYLILYILMIAEEFCKYLVKLLSRLCLINVQALHACGRFTYIASGTGFIERMSDVSLFPRKR